MDGIFGFQMVNVLKIKIENNENNKIYRHKPDHAVHIDDIFIAAFGM
jgi:hypothetical protein